MNNTFQLQFCSEHKYETEVTRPQVYVLDCGEDKYYVGWSVRLHRRLRHHFSGKGAVFTKRHKPRSLLYYGAGDHKEEFRIWKLWAALYGASNVGGYTLQP